MAGGQSRIETLASAISQFTADISDYLNSRGFPSPSFAIDAAPVIDLPPHLYAARVGLLEATLELHDLVKGPLAYLTGLASPIHNVLASLQFINEYDVASKIDLGDSVTYEELAERCDVNIEDFRRLLRLAIAFHIFEETKEGTVSHSAISRCMVDFPLARQWIGHFCDEVWPAGCKTAEALSRWPGSEESQETAFSLAHPSNEAFFKFLEANPARTERFTNGMRFLQSAPEFDVSHLLNDLQWSSRGCPKLIVDIGGADGSIVTAILRQNPSMKAVVQDLPRTASAINIPKDLEGRLSIMAHDMFCVQPVKGADVYFLRSTLHDWPDKYAVAILRNIIPALRDGAKVIVNEICMPGPSVLPYSQDQLLRGYDLAMKQLFNSKERDAQQWHNLFMAADPRFHLERITCSPGSILAVIEIVWKTESI